MLTEKNKQAIIECLAHIAKTLPGFQPRISQRKMIAEVAKVFARLPETEITADGKEQPKQQGESILVIEGPTGTGKSLAYLLPAIIMAKSQSKKLVISSATVMLQEQLANKDLPFLAKHAGLKISYTIAKGRGRYVCTHKLQQRLGNDVSQSIENTQQMEMLQEFNPYADTKPSSAMLEKMQQLANLLATRQWSGDRDALSEPVSDDLWYPITNDRHGCIKNHCAYFLNCPFFSAREKLDDVDIIIANHDLLLADIVMGGGVILPDPAETFYCIDEAHHLADKAIKQFAAYHAVNGTLTWLEKMKNIINRALLMTKQHHQAATIEQLIELITRYLIELRTILTTMPDLRPYTEKSAFPKTFRFSHGLLNPEFLVISNNLSIATQTLNKMLNFIADVLKKKLNEQPSGQVAVFEKALSELSFFIGRVENLADVWRLMTSTVSNSQEPPVAKWITAEYTYKSAEIEYVIYASPVRATDILSENFWHKISGAVLTSATLRSLGSFDMLLSMTGLKNFPATTCIALPSPFNFQQQGRLVIPAMQTDPKDALKHTQEIIQLLPDILLQADNQHGTLVLFASKKQMLDVYTGLPYAVQQLVLMQGDEPKEILLNKHFARINSDQPSALFGLASFAEGLDLPGKACKHVIIAKLPFAAPDDPVSQTLAEWIEQSGGNAFYELTLPNASIKLIQAVGRLIRSETDTGTVTILDTRLKTKSYGKLMLKSLPPFKIGNTVL